MAGAGVPVEGLPAPRSAWACPAPTQPAGMGGWGLGEEIYLRQKERDGSEGKGPSVLVVEIGLRVLGPVEQLIVDAGDVENQAHDQREACGKAGVLREEALGVCGWAPTSPWGLGRKPPTLW